MKEIFKEICNFFDLEGTIISYEKLKSGNINDTYIIYNETHDRVVKYLVQRFNVSVFKNPNEIAENINRVSVFIKRKMKENNESEINRKVIKMYSSIGNQWYYIDKENNWWRVLSYVYCSCSYDVANEKILHSTGVAFGKFQRYLNDFPAEELNITIQDFHNTKKRFADLKQAAAENKLGRLKIVQAEYEYLMANQDKITILDDLYKQGLIPHRVVHNDTKCNNVMFDAETGEPLAVIDLDTVMPGFVAHDFGDAVRFAANSAVEDEPNVNKVSFDLKKYECFVSGFIPQIKEMVTQEELKTLPSGVFIITLEIAARFLTDYLQGDTYFKITHPEHNIERTRCQIALAKDIYKKKDQLKEILAKYC